MELPMGCAWRSSNVAFLAGLFDDAVGLVLALPWSMTSGNSLVHQAGLEWSNFLGLVKVLYLWQVDICLGKVTQDPEREDERIWLLWKVVPCAASNGRVGAGFGEAEAGG